MSRISSGGAPVGKRFRYIDSQCPLVKSRNIAELQHVATTRRVGESGLSRCSSRYSCPITHCTRSFRYRIKPDPLSGSSTDGAEASSSNRRPASWQLVQKQEPVRIGGPTASNFTLPHWHTAERCLCCFWFTATSHSRITFRRLFWQWCEMSATGSKTEATLLPWQVRSNLRSRRRQTTRACPKSANSSLGGPFGVNGYPKGAGCLSVLNNRTNQGVRAVGRAVSPPTPGHP